MEPIRNRHADTIRKLTIKTITEAIKISNCTDCVTENCDISGNDSEHLFILWNCQNCTFISSHFHDRENGKCATKMDSDCDPEKQETYPMNNTFEDYEWYKLHNQEPLRIGDGRRSHLTYNTTISGYTFCDLHSDKETISIKSYGNKMMGCHQIYVKYNHMLGNTLTDNKSGDLPALLLVKGDIPHAIKNYQRENAT